MIGLRRGRPLVLLAFAGLWAGCASQSAAIRDALDELVRTEALAGGRVGVVVADAATGEVLAEHAAESGFATASNMKLISAAVALDTLGPDYRARTELVARGAIRDGTLDGDLVLRGYGDPTLDEAELAGMVDAAWDAGLRRVTGRVVADGSWLGDEQRGHGWQWDYLDAGYAAPFGGICLHGNTVTIRVRPGEPPVVEWEPAAYAGPEGSVGVGRTRVTASRALGSDAIVVGGTIRRDAEVVTLRVAVRDPERFAAGVLTRLLQRRGVAIDESAAAPEVGAGAERVLASHDSPPLAEIVGPLLTDSNNLYAEQVWRLAAKAARGSAATAAAARHTVEFFRRIGIDPYGIVPADGSGLSRRNLVQPHQLAELLLWVRDQPFRDLFVRSLPLAGRSGTLAQRFRGGLAADLVRAKTGYISRVVCLSGYVPRPGSDSEPLVFCVMLNDFTCPTQAAKDAVDRFVERLAVIAGW